MNRNKYNMNKYSMKNNKIYSAAKSLYLKFLLPNRCQMPHPCPTQNQQRSSFQTAVSRGQIERQSHSQWPGIRIVSRKHCKKEKESTTSLRWRFRDSITYIYIYIYNRKYTSIYRNAFGRVSLLKDHLKL